MSSSLFAKRTSGNLSLVITIESGSVGAGLYEVRADGSVFLVFTAREKIGFQRELSGDNLIIGMAKTLETVLARVNEHGIKKMRTEGLFVHPDNRITIILSSPWHASETKTLRLHFDHPTVITNAVVDGLLSEEEKSFERLLSKSEGVSEIFEPLERKIIETRLNGYVTDNPFGKEASDLELRVFECVTSREIVSRIKKIVSAGFPSEQIRLHAFSLAGFASVREHFPEVEHFLIVQIDGEVTDVTVVKKGVIAEMISFPFGHNRLLRQLAVICRDDPQCTLETLLSSRNAESISDVDKERVNSAIAETRALWLRHFSDATSGFSGEMFLPRTLFLFEDDEPASLFENFLKQAEASEFTITGEPFTVHKINDRSSAELFAGTAPGVPFDAVLSMAAGFASRFDA